MIKSYLGVQTGSRLDRETMSVLGEVLLETAATIDFKRRSVKRYRSLGEIAKLQNVNISFVMSDCSSACNSSAPTGWTFMKLDI